MGFLIEFNWTLKLKKSDGLIEEILKPDQSYKFSKSGHRVYPINMPIDLINNNWEAVAKVIVESLQIIDGRTCGKYKVLKIYSGEEKAILTNYWRETVQNIKNEKLDTFENVKVT